MRGDLGQRPEDQLLDRVLPAAYKSPPGEPPPRTKLGVPWAASRPGWARRGTRDLSWWRAPVPRIWTASLAFAQLAMRWHTPVRLLRFLDDARERDVLRPVAPIYESRQGFPRPAGHTG